MLTVGIPKEIKSKEKRVGMTPAGVRELCKAGLKVMVETGAGLESGFLDKDYSAAGAEIVPAAKTLYANAGLIQKVKEPLPAEYDLFHQDQILFGFLHLASPEHCGLVKALLKTGVTAIGYETVDVNGRMPLLAPMSRIAGALAAAFAGLIQKHKASLIKDGKIQYSAQFFKEMETIAATYPEPPAGVTLGETVIFGGGAAGQNAAEFALQMKSKVVLVEKEAGRRDLIKTEKIKYSGRLSVIGTEEVNDKILESADVLIGCVHRAGERAEKVVNEKTLQKISREKAKIIMDVSIDQGGNFPLAHSTSYQDPLYLDTFGNVRFAVANIPSLCGHGASVALAEATLPYTMALAIDFKKSQTDFPELRRAVNLQAGKIIHPAVKQAHETF